VLNEAAADARRAEIDRVEPEAEKLQLLVDEMRARLAAARAAVELD